ncbi:MAG TPA: alpha/beta hydrolase, partial [Thermoanaerobaculia bacterium]
AQTIRWEPFELPAGASGVTAQLGRMTVPLVRANPAAGSVELAFVRLQAAKRGAAAPIVYLPGGPGGDAISAMRSPRAVNGYAKLAEIGDVILLDPRGAGRSTPRAVCRPATPLEPHEKFADLATTLPKVIAAARACVAEQSANGVDVRGFTNRESAADLDDLRKALGVPKLSLFGFSYGTHVAVAAIRYHGANLERVVLAGTEGPNETRKLPSTLDVQLAKLSLLAGYDMTASLRRVLAKVAKEPPRVKVTDRARKQEVEVPIGPDALRRILVMDIGDGNDFPVFPALLQTLERGDSSILAWFVEKRYNQISGATDLMVLGMECSSGATALRQAAIEREAKTSLFANAMNGFYPDVCSALPDVDLGDDFRGSLVSNVPVLFISGTLDSNTPPYQAEELRWGMPRATHLVVENAGHEDTIPNREVQLAIADFFAGKDVSSRRIALRAPKFLGIEEAKQDRKR